MQIEKRELHGTFCHCVVLEKDEIPEFRKRLLESEAVDVLVPVRFLAQGTTLIQYGKTEGLIPYLDFLRCESETQSTKDRPILLSLTNLTLLRQILAASLACEDRLLDSRQVELSEQTVFIEPKTRTVKLLYLPPAHGASSLHVQLIALLHRSCAFLQDSSWFYYAEKVEDLLREEQIGRSALIKSIEKLARDAAAKGWPNACVVRNPDFVVTKTEQPSRATSHRAGTILGNYVAKIIKND